MARRNKRVSKEEISIALDEQRDFLKNEVDFLFPEAKRYLDKNEIVDFGKFCQKLNKIFDMINIKRASG
jgi:hypothetical protein